MVWGAGGMVALMGIAWLCSTDRRAVRPRTVVGALALQVGFGALVLSWSVGGRALEAASSGVQAVIDSSREGIGFLFGPVLPELGFINDKVPDVSLSSLLVPKMPGLLCGAHLQF